uniref:Peptidase S1 domain-containing protein n=1 Tax=Salarias fasciatus TaxID=181472 RepID=A0A672FF19_SALFA
IDALVLLLLSCSKTQMLHALQILLNLNYLFIPPECDDSYPSKITDRTVINISLCFLPSCPLQVDSGGPLEGRGCARSNYPGVYTKVCSLMPWIEDTLAKYS